MSQTEFYLLRHAPAISADWSNRERPLTPDGWDKARSLSPFLQSLGLDAVFASPYRRTQDTVAPLLRDLRLPLGLRQGLRESADDEELPQVRRRLIATVQQLAAEHPDQTLLLCTHGGCTWGLIKHFEADSTFEDYKQITSPDLKRFVFANNKGSDSYLDLDFVSPWTARTHIAGHPAFGHLYADRPYQPRPGAYALILAPDGRLATTLTPTGLHLPGGGIEAGESLHATLKREVMEECGLKIDSLAAVGEATHYTYSGAEDTYFRKECSFFTARPSAPLNAPMSAPLEKDHQLLWLDPASAEKQLNTSQSWAVIHLLK
jgi:broad specificity phosphatase PhoE/8-oxo-dGTP pyrophosphatase MutT (NUDIX family)